MLFRDFSTDGRLLFATRFLRLFAYGFLSVVLLLYLTGIGLSEWEQGALLSLTLLGDTVISLWLTTSADRIGRRKTLLAGAGLMALAGAVFAVTTNYWLLLAAATVGVISPSAKEVGPFLSVEQAALSQLVPDDSRTSVFAWYNLTGSVAAASGSLFGGLTIEFLQSAGIEGAASYRPLMVAYGVVGLLLALVFICLSGRIETAKVNAQAGIGTRLGLHKSRGVVFRLSALFAMDAFGGGFVLESIVAYWFYVRFQVSPAAIGSIFFAANLLAGASALSAASLAHRFGLVNTMVFTHLPSNVLLILVPLMPSAWLAIAVLLVRYSISQMDVPTRQSYTMALVSPDERSAAAGVTGVARSIGASLSPSLAGICLASATLFSLPFFLAGGIKIAYDLLLYRGFVRLREADHEAGAKAHLYNRQMQATPGPSSSASQTRPREALAVLTSGGVESSILLAESVRATKRVYPIYVRCGHHWENVELDHLRQFMAAVTSTALEPLVLLEMPLGDLYPDHWSITGKDVPDADSPDQEVFLPGRNVFLLSKSMIWCHFHGVGAVALGSLATNPFLDATPEFFSKFQGVMNQAIAGAVQVVLPYAGLDKVEVLRRGREFPLELTFSCIQSSRGAHCGRCNKCAERRQAFANAGIIDRTVYNAVCA